MSWLFEEEKPGIQGEPSRARVYLKLAVLGWCVFCLSWLSGLSVLFGAMFLVLGVLSSVRALFHLITLAIMALPEDQKRVAQVILAICAAGLPLIYLFPTHEVPLTSGIFVQAFRGIGNWPLWVSVIVFVYITHKAVLVFPKPLVPIRRYLYAVAVVFVIVFASGHGALSTDEDGLSDAPFLDPKSTEGKVSMAASYLRLILLAYGTILYTEIRHRALLKARPTITGGG